MTDSMTYQDLQPLLKTKWLGRRAVMAESLPSTNRTAMELGSAGEPSGLIVTAGEQTAGRGRFTRVWHSPKGLNLYLTMLLRPALPPCRLPELSMLTAIALHDTLVRTAPECSFGLKWPNDLWVRDRKISGILCEADSSSGFGLHAAVGLGLNINSTIRDFPEELQNTATSLKILTGKNYPVPRILADFLNIFESYFDRWSASRNFDEFIDIWNQYEILTGRMIRIQEQNGLITGTARGINKRGELLLELKDTQELRCINAGDIHILR